MFFSKTFAVAILSAAVANANPFLSTRQNGVTCQTSDASPINSAITNVINEVRGKGGSCPNTNGDASKCTTIADQDGAHIGVCGEVDSDDAALTCEQVASYANQIQQTCQRGAGGDDKAGGTFTVSAGKSIILF